MKRLASDAMLPLAGKPKQSVDANDPIQEVMSKIANIEAPLGVKENGKLIGLISKSSILERLVSSSEQQ